MHVLDWAMVCAYFVLMIVIGWWSHKRVSDVKDFFTAGGKMPWWLAGISHHMSGYSAVMFTGYAGIAYTYGVTRVPGESLPAAIGRTPNFMTNSFPQRRYADEDVATGLVPFEALADRLGIDCEPITRVIDLYERETGSDARATGRDLRDFDLDYLRQYLRGESRCLALVS